MIAEPNRTAHLPFWRAVWLLAAPCLLCPAGFVAGAPAEGSANAEADVAAARALFEANLDAIRHRDRDAYLACYLQSEQLARTGPGGVTLGFESLAASAGESWPDSFDARDLELVPVRPGVVYGIYRYRVRYGEREETGRSERVFLDTPDGWKIAVTTAFSSPPGTAPPPLALLGATLVDGTGAPPVADAAVIIGDGRVQCAGARAECPVPEGVEKVDFTGHWITPGVVDAHVHFSQTAWADGRPDSLDVRSLYPYEEVEASLRAHPERFWHAELCSGVTAVFDVGGYPWTWQLPERAARDGRAPHISAAGPLLSTLDHWLNLPAERQFIYLADPEAAKRGVEYLAAHGTDAVKIWFIAAREGDPGQHDDAVLAAGAAAREHGLPLIVHATELREAKVALRAGAHLLVHSVWDQPVDDEFLDLARQNGAVYCPTLTVGMGYLKMFEAAAAGTPPAVDDPNGCVDPETLEKVARTASLGSQIDLSALTSERLAARRERNAESERIGAENLLRVHRAGIPIAMGTDAGNPLTLHGPSVYAEMEAMQAAGLSPLEVLVASTLGGARAMGKEADFGTVEAGRAADLLVVDADPTADIRNLRKLRYVVRGGELLPLAELRPAGGAF